MGNYGFLKKLFSLLKVMEALMFVHHPMFSRVG